MPDQAHPPPWLHPFKNGHLGVKPGGHAGSRAPAHPATAMTASHESDAISPLMLAKSKEVDGFNLDQSHSSHRSAAPGRRVSIRRPRAFSSSSPRVAPLLQPARQGSKTEDDAPKDEDLQIDSILDQVVEWLHDEKKKRRSRKHWHHRTSSRKPSKDSQTDGASNALREDDSGDSDSSLALEKLEDILKSSKFLARFRRHSSIRTAPRTLRHSSSAKRLRRPSTIGPSSDTEYVEGDALVPSCEAVLDNSKTLSYGIVGPSSSQISLRDTDDALQKNKEAWSAFKYEIVRLTHTLRVKGWRQVSMDRCDEVEVERLSGALTNAVYVVTPPRVAPSAQREETQSSDQNSAPSQLVKRRMPKKLLLRVYGPQVEHLIDREAELMTLRRLARQRIGPRLLGTFTNGRFEEFLHAKTLTPQDLRDPQTSMQIAKRMRELHDGIELLEEERTAGPFVWRNWDKWVERCEKVVTFVDRQVLGPSRKSASALRYKKRGLICGTEWSVFKAAVYRYRKWLEEQYGGAQGIIDQLVFAHNDTQYGNILRLEPPGESPLLLPANKHKQLVVIDFEYSNANTPGLEFANHFTEWCYNYHDTEHPHVCNTTRYPTPEEQARFLQVYASHKPAFAPAASTPRLSASMPSLGPRNSYTSATAASRRPTSSARDSSASSSLTLGAPAMTSSQTLTEEPAPLARTDSSASTETATSATDSAAGEVARLARETALWRAANSTQWVAWGIVQARVPGLDAARACGAGGEEGSDGDEADDEDEEEEFDYLSYARERAMFFWGDAVQLGIVSEASLPEDVQEGMKIVRF